MVKIDTKCLWTLCAALLMALILSGCVTSRVEEARHQSTSLQEDEAIVILGRASYNERETEKSFTQCITKALSSGNKSVRLIPESEFKDQLYPWFEPRTAPASVDDLSALFAQPGVREQIEKTKIKYLAWIDGNTVTSDKGGSMSCALGPYGGGCFGMSYWEENASYIASIWDLESLSTAGEISADASGTSYMAGFIVPIPVIARPGNEACKVLAKQLKNFLINES